MAKYRVKSPDGQTYEVTAPDDATEEQVIAYAQQNMPKEKKSPLRMAAELTPKSRAATGIGEAALNLGTSALAGPVSGFAGLAGAALPGPQGQGAKWAEKTSEALTYEPKTESGKKATNIVTYPFRKLSELGEAAGGKVTDVTGSPALGTAANVALQALPMAVSKAGKPAAAASKAKALGEISREAEKSKTLAEGQKEGYVTMPESMLAKGATSIGGKDAVKHMAIEQNQEVTNKLARRAASLPENEAISTESLAAARERLAEPYRQVEALPGLPPPRTTSNLNPMRNPYPLIGETPKTPKELVRDWKSTNNQAMDLWRDYQRNAKVETLEAYREKIKAKEAIEDNIEKAAQAAGRPDLVDALRDARVKLAKNFDVERALILGSGDVDPRWIGAEYKRRKGKGMTGELETIAKFANTYQPVMRASPKISPHGGTHGSAIESAALALGGHEAMATGLPFVRGLARYAALSELGQPEPLTKPGLRVRLSDMATKNPYAFAVAPSIGLRRPEE